jgi:5'-3' exonuclease
MGVLRLFRHLIKRYQNFFSTFPAAPQAAQQVDYLLLDLNAIFHPACREIYFPEFTSLLRSKLVVDPKIKEQQAFANVVKFIDKILAVIQPTQVLYLAIDGVAGMCKQSQQRKRRYKGGSSKAGDVFDTCHLTAGTPYMARLCKYIAQTIIERKKSGVWKNLQVIYSDMYVAGEGEHKLIRWLSTERLHKRNFSYCVYSPDADLIMLCMCLSKGVGYILRENIYDDVNGKWILVRCDDIKVCLSKDLEFKSTQLKNDENNVSSGNVVFEPQSAIRDYVLFLMLIGNDFLPSLYCLEIGNEGIETLIKCYTKAAYLKGYLVNPSNVICKPAFTELFKELASYEPALILSKYYKRVQYPDELLASCIVHGDQSVVINDQQSNTKSQTLDFERLRIEYYKQKFTHDGDDVAFDWSTPEKIQANITLICKCFVRGLNFVMTYYAQSIPTFDWCYEFHYAPLMTDIYAFAHNCSQREWNQMQEWNYKQPLTLNQSLLGVIPPSSYAVLPASIQPLLVNNKDHPLFTEVFKVDYQGKQQEYEGICLLPNVSYNTLKTMCKDKYKAHDPIVF